MTATAIPTDVPDAPGGTAPATRTTGVAATTGAVARRTLRKFFRTPQTVVLTTMQGALFLLIFRYVFGGAIDGGPVPYVDFLVPGYVVTGVLFGGMLTAAGVAEDVEGGFFDRLRSLPVHRSALLLGRVLADTVLVGWASVVTGAIGFAVGFRLHGDLGQALAAAALILVFGFAFTWLFACIGLVAGNAQAAQGMAMIVFPLTFVSSAYVPIATMPSWMRPVAEHQPITVMVDAVRALVLGDPALAGLTQSTGHYVVVSLLWCAGIVAVCVPFAVARYRRS